MSALNYAANAVRDLRFIAPQIPDTDDVLKLAGAIQEAVHFQLPDGGRLLEDGLRGIRGREIRLPYPSITVEYHVPDAMHRLDGLRPFRCNQRLALAVEVRGSLLQELVRGLKDSDKPAFENGAIVITVANQLPRFDRWVPLPTAWLMPMKWDYPDLDRSASIILSEDSKTLNSNEPAIVGYPIPHLKRWTEDMALSAHKERGVSRNDALRDMVSDIGDEVCAVMALIEAASCSNVRSEVIQKANPGVNARRARDGKLPIYEVRVLTVEVPGTHGRNVALGGHHASPRQHLRRGHVRRLPTEADPLRQIWVNSHLVGDATKGKIDKSYQLETSREPTLLPSRSDGGVPRGTTDPLGPRP